MNQHQETLEPPSNQDYDDLDYPGEEPTFTVEVPADAKPLIVWYVERQYKDVPDRWFPLENSMFTAKDSAFQKLKDIEARFPDSIANGKISHRILEVTYMPIREEVIS